MNVIIEITIKKGRDAIRFPIVGNFCLSFLVIAAEIDYTTHTWSTHSLLLSATRLQPRTPSLLRSFSKVSTHLFMVFLLAFFHLVYLRIFSLDIIYSVSFVIFVISVIQVTCSPSFVILMSLILQEFYSATHYFSLIQ